MANAVRTFVAIELPEEVRAYLAAQQAALGRAGGDVRWIRPELVHLTLAFLGDVPANDIVQVTDAVREAAAGTGPVGLHMGGTGCFPPRGRPRVIWVGVEDLDGALAQLQAAVAEATAPFAEKPERRDYQPHLTLGRTRGGDLHALSDAVAASAETHGPEFEADEIVVMKSTLSRSGPEYDAMARVAL